jgi:hypothetical protein
MKSEPISPDDPRLTLYAIGEMEPAERAAFEQQLAQDAEARRLVEEIRATAAAVAGALEHEAAQPHVAASRPAGRILRFPQLYFMISGLAAACFALFFVVWRSQHEQRPRTQLTEVALVPPAEALAADNAAAGAPRPEPTVTMVKTEPLAAVAPSAEPLPVAGMANQTLNALEDRVAARTMKEVHAQYATMEAASRKQAAERPAAAPAEARVAARAGDEMKRDAFAAVVGGRERGGFVHAAENPRSVFPFAVGRVAYGEVKRFLAEGRLPPVEVVRIEELVNHFAYDYAAPAGGALFAASLEVAGAPWAPEHRLVRVGLRAGETVSVRDVRVQVEFDPAQVAAYRLIGFEGGARMEAAGREAGSEAGESVASAGGRAVTALYEVVPVAEVAGAGVGRGPLLRVSVARREEGMGAAEWTLADGGARFEGASADFKFAAAVAGFGLVLRDAPQRGAATLAGVAEWARAGLGADAGGARAEFLTLVRAAVVAGR